MPIGRVVTLLAGLAGGVGFSQVPEFVQQYEQRLGGRVDELTRFVEGFDADARRFDLAREDAIDRFKRSSEAFLRTRGEAAEAMIERLDWTQKSKIDLEQAGPFERTIVFLRAVDGETARNTLTDFEPAVPVTLEGAVHTGIGFLFGAGIAGGIARMTRRLAKRPKSVTDPDSLDP